MKVVAAIALLAVALGAAAFLWDNRVLIERHYTQEQTSQPDGYQWYQPTEPIPGAHNGFFEVAPADQRSVTREALDAAYAYAEKNRSESLLIWHRGALQLAAYWLGLGPDDVVNSRSMHKMVGGLLIARAIAEGHIGSVDESVATYISPGRAPTKRP